MTDKKGDMTHDKFFFRMQYEILKSICIFITFAVGLGIINDFSKGACRGLEINELWRGIPNFAYILIWIRFYEWRLSK